MASAPNGSRKPKDPIDLILRRVEITRLGCWLTSYKLNSAGYVVVIDQRGPRKRTLLGHRVVYEHFKGSVPEGLQLDHLCRDRGCVNPDHLEAVTPQVNQLRGDSVSGKNARKTHCPKDHPLSGDNLYVDPKGKRRCRLCRQEEHCQRVRH